MSTVSDHNKTNLLPITHIICDLSDVLIKGLEGVEDILSQEMGLSSDVINKQMFTYDYSKFWLGNISEDRFFTDMIKYFNWPIDILTIKKCIRSNFQPIPGSWEIYKQLSQKYVTILASVNAREWVSYLEAKYTYYDLFPNRIHYSYEVGFTKRDQEFYLYLLDMYSITPDNTFMIDDSTNNLKTAQTVGIRGLKFVSSTQLFESLKHFKILG